MSFPIIVNQLSRDACELTTLSLASLLVQLAIELRARGEVDAGNYVFRAVAALHPVSIGSARVSATPKPPPRD